MCSKTSSFYICSIFSIPLKWHSCASGYPTGSVHRALLLCTASSHIIYRYKLGAHAEHVYHIRASLLAHEMEINYELRLERTDLQGNRLEMIRSIRQKAEWQREVTHYQRLKKGKSAFALSGFTKYTRFMKHACAHTYSLVSCQRSTGCSWRMGGFWSHPLQCGPDEPSCTHQQDQDCEQSLFGLNTENTPLLVPSTHHRHQHVIPNTQASGVTTLTRMENRMTTAGHYKLP